jgi:uncharacterized membrane protein YqiK
MDVILNHKYWVIAVVAGIVLLACYRLILWLMGVVFVPDDSVGVVTKKFVLFGRNRSLPDGRIVALNGEAGFQADTLSPGMHAGLWPWQYTVERVKFLTIPQGKVGCVEACDGKPLASGRIVAREVACDSFQDARAFLGNGGERGPQMSLIPPGTYRINTLLFKLSVVDAVVVPPGKIGVVEARDGRPLPSGRVIARHVECDSFQNGQAFIEARGERGPQVAVMTPGTYRINPFLFSVSLADVIDVPDDKIGVVMTREGNPLPAGEIAGPTVAGHDMYQNPQAFIDAKGCKGLQEQVLLAGRYFINPRFATVELVDMVEVPIAHVGVVIAFVGKEARMSPATRFVTAIW